MRKGGRRGSGALVLPEMPDRTVMMLSFAAGIIFFMYIVMVIVTVTFATVQTGLAAAVRTTEGEIAQLETTYYAAIAQQNAATPASIGLVAPESVTYAIAKPTSGLSYAGQ